MLTIGPGPDPYFAYKFHHVERAKTAWVLSEEFGLYEAMRAGPATVPEVSERIGLEERPTAVLLAANACVGVLGMEEDRYYIYPVMREMVLEGGLARTAPRTPDPEDWWYRIMKEALLTNAPVPEALPEWLANPQGNEDSTAFAPSRHGWRILWGHALAEAVDFSPFRTVADLGGATGGVLVGLTERCPHLQGIVVELPYSRKTAEAAIRQSNAEDRVRFHAADFFTDPFPDGVDVFFMSHIIHDWDDEHCIRLLRRCHDALPAGSPVLVQEYLLNEDRTAGLIAVFQWFGLMFGTTGDQRTGPEIEALMGEAGFSGTECRPLDHEQGIAIGWKR
ncbi:MAG: methyltransferase [Gemmatimonadetes bacterium]|nr:methyltransferase [Gemmatimonadota bacterium]